MDTTSRKARGQRPEKNATGDIAAITVTNQNFEELLIESAEQALAIHRGEKEPARVTILSARRAAVTPPPEYGGSRVRRIRRRLKVSQQVFAGLMNVSGSTVRSWEQGTRVPDGASRRLLEVAERSPDAILAALDEV